MVMARLTSLKMETEVCPTFQKLHSSAAHFLIILSSIFSSPFGVQLRLGCNFIIIVKAL